MQRPLQVRRERRERLFDAAGPANQDMVRTRYARCWQDLAGKIPKPPFHPVPDNGISNLFCDSETDANLWIAIGTVTHQQHEAARGGPFSVIGGQKF